MNNRGFTLIELTAVIVVLVAIFLVSFPSFINISKSDKEKQYNNMVKDLCLSGESYIYSNVDSFEGLSTVGSKITISIEELILYGNVEKNLVNVKTEEKINNDSLIYTVLNDYSLNYYSYDS